MIGVAILDLTDSQLGRKSSNYTYTQAQLVDEELFSNRPGLEVVQILWHPGIEGLPPYALPFSLAGFARTW